MYLHTEQFPRRDRRATIHLIAIVRGTWWHRQANAYNYIFSLCNWKLTTPATTTIWL